MRLGILAALGTLILSVLAPTTAHAQSMRTSSTSFGIGARIGGARVHYSKQTFRSSGGRYGYGYGYGSPGWCDLPVHPAYYGYAGMGPTVEYHYSQNVEYQDPRPGLVRSDLLPVRRPWWFDNCDRRLGPVYDPSTRSYLWADPDCRNPVDRIIVREIRPDLYDCSACRAAHTTAYCPFQNRAYYDFLERYQSADCTYCGARGHYLSECRSYARVTDRRERVEVRERTYSEREYRR